jgi:hypothetical protein
MLKEEDVWLKAFCAAVSSNDCSSETAIRIADKCLAAFKERFRK